MDKDFTPYLSRYVIITPARNESALISGTIESMARQTLKPLKWIIVNDGSTDNTLSILESFAKKYDFIQIVNVERTGGRDFGAKARAFKRGLDELGHRDFDFIGCLDADITVDKDYFELNLKEFARDEKLGLFGGCVGAIVSGKFVTTDRTLDSVGGAVQLFRKACFEAVGGGYTPLRWGGIDALAEVRAKIRGWKVRKSIDLHAIQGRDTGSVETPKLKAKFLEGLRFHSLGYGMFYYVLRCAYRSMQKPIVLGSLAALSGYIDSAIRRRPIVVEDEVVAFWRGEHRQKLHKMFFRNSRK